MKGRLILLAVMGLALGACGAPAPTDWPTMPPSPPPGPWERDAFVSPVQHLPSVHRDSGRAPLSEKIGAAGYQASTEAIGLLSLAWCYDCPRDVAALGVERWYTLGSQNLIELFAGGLVAPAEHVLFANEPDLAYWAWPPAIEWVADVAALVAQWPEVHLYGPCLSSPELESLDYLGEWMATYEQVNGAAFPLEAVCLHCYGEASACADGIAVASATAAREWGVDRVVVTEFNLPPGETYSAGQVAMHNGCLQAWMEAAPFVAAYAFWPVGILYYGDAVPSDPVLGWQPLTYQYRRTMGDLEPRLTYLGRAYSGALPSWEACVAGGYLRADQVPAGPPTPVPFTRVPPTATP